MASRAGARPHPESSRQAGGRRSGTVRCQAGADGGRPRRWSPPLSRWGPWRHGPANPGSGVRVPGRRAVDPQMTRHQTGRHRGAEQHTARRPRCRRRAAALDERLARGEQKPRDAVRQLSGGTAAPRLPNTLGDLRSSHAGSHRARRPSICRAAGTMRLRMITASRRMATARPSPNCWSMRSSLRMKAPKMNVRDRRAEEIRRRLRGGRPRSVGGRDGGVLLVGDGVQPVDGTVPALLVRFEQDAVTGPRPRHTRDQSLASWAAMPRTHSHPCQEPGVVTLAG